LKSSRNAFRHGLSVPLRLDSKTSAKAEAIARMLAPDQVDEKHVAAATEVAQAQLELLRIRGVRAKLMSAVDLATGNLEHLQRLAALDRYERFAHTKRQRASRKLEIPVAEIERRACTPTTQNLTPRAFLSERTQFSGTSIRTVLSERTHFTAVGI
jgi:hypothetical protein